MWMVVNGSASFKRDGEERQVLDRSISGMSTGYKAEHP